MIQFHHCPFNRRSSILKRFISKQLIHQDQPFRLVDESNQDATAKIVTSTKITNFEEPTREPTHIPIQR